MACCIFNGCFNKPFPCGTLVFFNLPKDEPRRRKWLQLSGNEDVQNLPASARRLVCENHFEERYVRRQFHRTTLARDAVPMDYRKRKGDSSVIQIDEALDEITDTIKEEEAPATDKEEILLTLAIEEADYEVLIEHEPSEGSEPKDDLETHLIEDEESCDEREATECKQIADCSDDLARESDEVVETFEVDAEEAGEDHKVQEDVGNTNTLDSSLDVVTTGESKPDENFGHEDMTGEQTEEPDELVEDVVIEEAESEGCHEAKHKLPNSVESSQQAKRFKSDEVVEPDTSSVSVTPAKPQAIEQPSTSSCTSSDTVAPAAPAPAGKMSEEEYFALSLVGPLQRLPPGKRAIAKMKILTYLVQLECGLTDANL
ncbi:uncharacterized protein LOC6039102 isoform X2 [Culex quinquefasciatus]|uniref:uncharacterized protein LOC6039102 isoform X2 n=1 Tax=Culex quinquefasciatus TaxID=7176 RepID=UPI0018E2FC16|nr:uncharacterized protein LOC6039102 isoform X2 [Culex quinquefasciatus]